MTSAICVHNVRALHDTAYVYTVVHTCVALSLADHSTSFALNLICIDSSDIGAKGIRKSLQNGAVSRGPLNRFQS